MFDLEGMPPTHRRDREDLHLGPAAVRRGRRPVPRRRRRLRRARRPRGLGGLPREADAIFAEHGDVPFVHWASYEQAKINLYLERYGDRDGVAERVKDNLLDLLPITRDSVAVPLSGYGLKEIETLTGYERQLEEFGGEWSMARYIEATETRDEAERAAIMDEILAYNREDLEATWAVMEWLLEPALPGRARASNQGSGGRFGTRVQFGDQLPTRILEIRQGHLPAVRILDQFHIGRQMGAAYVHWE